MWEMRREMAQPTRRWVLLILLAAILSACSKHSQPSPQVYFQTVRAEFQRGDLVAAQAEADRAYEQYQKTNPDWAWRFRVLQAETLVWQGLSKNALTLLDAELPASLSTDEAAVRRKITRGLAYTFLQQFAEAENQLGEAEKLASKNQPKLLGEVALSQGTLLVLREEFQASEAAFLRALKLARQENLHFLEANAMGSLGLVNMKMQHYGEAIDWYKASSKLAESLGARTVMAKNTGNMGWCFYRIGNLDSARKLFTEADGLSEQLGLQKDELRWLTNLGVMYYDRREFDAAQDYYQRALRIAKQLDDKLDTAISLDNLALIAIKQQKLDDAERYNQEALSLQGTGISRLYSVYNDGKISAGRKNFKRAESLLQHVIQKSERDFSLRLDAETALAELYVTLKQSLPAEQTYQRALATISQARSTLKQDEYKLTFLAN